MDNNIFNPNRFYKLIVRNLKSTQKYWFQGLLIFAGLPLLILLINLSSTGLAISLNNRMLFIDILIRSLAIVSPFILFFNYNHPKKGLTEVMLAASVFEKYVAMQLACLLFPLIILILFGGVDSLLSFLFPRVHEGYAIQQILNNNIDWNRITSILLFQQTVFFFNMLFVNKKAVKTLGVFILYFIALTATIVITISIWESRIAMADFRNLNFDYTERGLFTIYSNDHPIILFIQYIRIFTQVVVPLIFMTGSYFVMKNKRY